MRLCDHAIPRLCGSGSLRVCDHYAILRFRGHAILRFCDSDILRFRDSAIAVWVKQPAGAHFRGHLPGPFHSRPCKSAVQGSPAVRLPPFTAATGNSVAGPQRGAGSAASVGRRSQRRRQIVAVKNRETERDLKSPHAVRGGADSSAAQQRAALPSSGVRGSTVPRRRGRFAGSPRKAGQPLSALRMYLKQTSYKQFVDEYGGAPAGAPSLLGGSVGGSPSQGVRDSNLGSCCRMVRPPRVWEDPAMIP
eukprot:gene1997-biopygen2254